MAPETASPPKLQTGSQFLTEDFLRFWMVDICREGRGWRPAPQNSHKVHPTGARGNCGWDGGGEKANRTQGECLSSSWLPELLGRGRHKTQAQLSLCFCGVPENWNLSGLGLGSARNSGPTPYRAAWSLSSVDGESSHARAGANPVWPEQCECSPHTPVTFVCSAPPSPQHD